MRSVLDNVGIDLHSSLRPCFGDEIPTINHQIVNCKEVVKVFEDIFRWWGIGRAEH